MSTGDFVAVVKLGNFIFQGNICLQSIGITKKKRTRTLENGWLKTGDLAKVDEDGDYYIVGRKKEMIISRWRKCISTRGGTVHHFTSNMFEKRLSLDVEDDKWGECVSAFVSCRMTHRVKAGDIIIFLQTISGSYKVPKKLTLLTELPRTDVGK